MNLTNTINNTNLINNTNTINTTNNTIIKNNTTNDINIKSKAIEDAFKRASEASETGDEGSFIVGMVKNLIRGVSGASLSNKIIFTTINTAGFLLKQYNTILNTRFEGQLETIRRNQARHIGDAIQDIQDFNLFSRLSRDQLLSGILRLNQPFVPGGGGLPRAEFERITSLFSTDARMVETNIDRLSTAIGTIDVINPLQRSYIQRVVEAILVPFKLYKFGAILGAISVGLSVIPFEYDSLLNALPDVSADTWEFIDGENINLYGMLQYIVGTLNYIKDVPINMASSLYGTFKPDSKEYKNNENIIKRIKKNKVLKKLNKLGVNKIPKKQSIDINKGTFDKHLNSLFNNEIKSIKPTKSKYMIPDINLLYMIQDEKKKKKESKKFFNILKELKNIN
jgi:hypothetical protein